MFIWKTRLALQDRFKVILGNGKVILDNPGRVHEHCYVLLVTYKSHMKFNIAIDWKTISFSNTQLESSALKYIFLFCIREEYLLFDLNKNLKKKSLLLYFVLLHSSLNYHTNYLITNNNNSESHVNLIWRSFCKFGITFWAN